MLAACLLKIDVCEGEAFAPEPLQLSFYALQRMLRPYASNAHQWMSGLLSELSDYLRLKPSRLHQERGFFAFSV
jgi:hypothetical protein